MRWIKGILDFIFFSNLWIAIGAYGLSLRYQYYLQQRILFDELPIFIASATFISYTLHRIIAVYFKKYPSKDPIIKWSRTNASLLQAALFFSIGICAFLFFHFSPVVQKVILIIGAITFGYSVPFFRWDGKWYRLRDLGWIKIFLIAFIWSATCVYLNYIHFEIEAKLSTLLFPILECFLFFVLITLPFDIRDKKYDKKNNLLTVPILLSEQALMVVMIALAVLCFLLNYCMLYLQVNLDKVLILSHFMFYSFAVFLCLKANAKRSPYYFLGLVDGLIILSSLLTIGYYVLA